MVKGGRKSSRFSCVKEQVPVQEVKLNKTTEGEKRKAIGFFSGIHLLLSQNGQAQPFIMLSTADTAVN